MKPKRKPKFADVVRRWRESRKLSKVEAARRLGVPYRTFQDWELGNRTPKGFARRLITQKLSLWLTLAAILWLTLAATAEATDGNQWQRLNRQQKLDYVTGLHDGMLAMLRAIDHQELMTELFGNSQTPQWVDGLDSFYADFRNRSIFAADALAPVAMAINGTPREQIILRIEQLRISAANAILIK